MSRRVTGEITPLAWRAAVISLVLVTSTLIVTALFIAQQGQAIKMALRSDQLDGQWTIRSGGVEAGRLTLRPTAHAIGLALRPIAAPDFTLQARVAFTESQGAAGLIVQADDVDHFSTFLISGDGYFRLSDYRNGAWIDRVAWRAWPHIRRDGAANMLRAECQADTCTFFVNDEWTWQERALADTHWIGVMADAWSASVPFEVYFDQISRGP